VFTSLEFSDAMLVLLNQQIDVLLLCHSLHDDERRGILETPAAITHYDGGAVPIKDVNW